MFTTSITTCYCGLARNTLIFPVLVALSVSFNSNPALAAEPDAANPVIWVEGESATKHSMNRHPWWYDQVKVNELSGGDFISNFDDKKPGEASYSFQSSTAGKRLLWVRINPVKSKVSYNLNSSKWIDITIEGKSIDTRNIAADEKIDLRFIAWVSVGEVDVKSGSNTIDFKIDGEASHHGALDCFVLADDSFVPSGKLKPSELAVATKAEGNWVPFAPGRDQFPADCPIDLRWLNERFAGENGRILAKNGKFIHETNSQPVRFWAVNGPSSDDQTIVKYEARLLAKYGVNLARIHHGYYNEQGQLDQTKVIAAIQTIESLKAEGIYSLLSVYFPLWMTPDANNPTLKGYNGSKKPFASLMFNPEFQKLYQSWWTAILTTPSPTTGKALIDEPALMGVEIQNEDSFFFWTFNNDALPDPQLRLLETQFATWAKKKHGGLKQALAKWDNQQIDRDSLSEARLGFRPLWNIANERTPRDQETARFLLETQQSFYANQKQFIQKLGYQGLVTCSNWVTADERVLGPLEKYSYTVGDFIDRHGYFGCQHKGDSAEWSVRNGHTYTDRSYLKFDSEEPGKPLQFEHPAIDTQYNDLPSIISETTWNRPNRYRTEAPLFYAVFGALQDSDSIVNFAFDGGDWSVQPGYFMQPWTLCAPTQMGQFPAAALLYRQGYVKEGDVVADIQLGIEDTLNLSGTPLPQGASFDELRLKDVPAEGKLPKAGQVLDPLLHYAGQAKVRFAQKTTPPKLANLSKYIDHKQKTIKSTTGEINWNYGQGFVTVASPKACLAFGQLKSMGETTLGELTINSDLELGSIALVSLDGADISQSKKLLLQVMSEEQTTGWRTESLGERSKRIVDIGRSPWQIRQLEGTIAFKGQRGQSLSVTTLDLQGQRVKDYGSADSITLDPSTCYYLLETK